MTLNILQSHTMSPTRNEPIAIVGSGCRFPGGSTSTSKLWDLLHNPRDVSQEIGTGRFNLDRFYHKDGNHHGTTNTRRGYLLSDDIHNFEESSSVFLLGKLRLLTPSSAFC
jgi:acyl transferase domain-containing protein